MAVNEETSVYVGGLPNAADEDMLRGYFEPCGTIVSIKVKRQLDNAIQMRKDLENEVSLIKDKITTKDHHIADLQKKSQKLEKQLAAARKVSSGELLVARKLYKYLLELQDFDDRAKNAENDLKALIHATMTEIDMAEDATTRDGSGYENSAL